MSGGSFNYMSYEMETKLEEAQTALSSMTGIVKMMAAISHEMEWGASGDTCYACAKLRTIAGLESFFYSGGTDYEEAVKVVNNRNENLCARCQARKSK